MRSSSFAFGSAVAFFLHCSPACCFLSSPLGVTPRFRRESTEESENTCSAAPLLGKSAMPSKQVRPSRCRPLLNLREAYLHFFVPIVVGERITSTNFDHPYNMSVRRRTCETFSDLSASLGALSSYRSTCVVKRWK
jgi:hypothetical protein